MHSWPVRISGVLLVALLAACATPVSTNIKPSAANVAKYNDLSDLNVVAALEKNVNDAKVAGMSFLAPHYYREAVQVLSECQGQLGNKPKDVLVSNAAKGDAILEKGRAVMEIVKYRFSRELELKAQLDAHDTAKLLPKDYEPTIARLSGLIEKVEREQAGNLDKDKEALQKSMLDLLIKAVQEGALHESETINADSKKNNAEKQAPLTYAEALKVYQDAKKQIAAAHHDEKLVQRLGAQALFAAHHAQQVNERVATLQNQLNVSSGGGAGMGVAAGGVVSGAQMGMQVSGGSSGAEKLSLEKIVVQEEDRLLGISSALGLGDLRDLALDKQVAEIKRAASELAKSSSGAAMQDLEARLKTANDATQQAMAQLAAKDKQLQAQAAQLVEKEAHIQILNDKVAKLEAAKKPAAKPKKK